MITHRAGRVENPGEAGAEAGARPGHDGDLVVEAEADEGIENRFPGWRHGEECIEPPGSSSWTESVAREINGSDGSSASVWETFTSLTGR